MRQLAPGRCAVEGTPADCVRVALHDLAPEPTLVLAGINAGGNLGADVYHSGTVAAVREAVLHGRMGIAVSQYRRRGVPFDWDRAAVLVLPVLRDTLTGRIAGLFWNVNLPHLARRSGAGGRFCPLDPARCRSASAARPTAFTTKATITPVPSRRQRRGRLFQR